MRDHELAMRVYVELAAISDRKQQVPVRDRFLLLAAVEACRAGWPEVAACCREKLITSNHAHQAHRHETIAEALRHEEFQQLVAHWERYCPFEKAEAMLRELHLPKDTPSDLSVGEQMLKILG